MNPAYILALSALAGSAIGALASLSTIWLTQRSQSRAQQLIQTRNRRETLYGEFIEEASRIFDDAFSHDLEDLTKLMRLYGIVGKMRLFASLEVIEKADLVLRAAVAAYQQSTIRADKVTDLKTRTPEYSLRAFSLSCRRDLDA